MKIGRWNTSGLKGQTTTYRTTTRQMSNNSCETSRLVNGDEKLSIEPHSTLMSGSPNVRSGWASLHRDGKNRVIEHTQTNTQCQVSFYNIVSMFLRHSTCRSTGSFLHCQINILCLFMYNEVLAVNWVIHMQKDTIFCVTSKCELNANFIFENNTEKNISYTTSQKFGHTYLSYNSIFHSEVIIWIIKIWSVGIMQRLGLSE